MRYDKLVRDKIPEIIRYDNGNPVTHVADEKEYWEKLKEKLKEEAEEFYKNNNNEELADILEVIEGICYFRNIKREEIEEIRLKKEKERGGFKKRIILEEII